jgi:hypothetical protein
MQRPMLVASLILLGACQSTPKAVQTNRAAQEFAAPRVSFNQDIEGNANRLLEEGREIFRNDTFGSEAFWGGQLRLHETVIGRKHGGRGAGLTPMQALQLGLKVDVGRVPALLIEVIRGGGVGLKDPDTTVELLKADAVVGVKAIKNERNEIVSMGITCALCHSTVDDSLIKGIGRRLDGWPNRDLDVGQIVASAPTLKPIADTLGVDEETVKKVLLSWGPGKYDAELNFDGKAMRPDGKSGATVLPAAFGLAGQNLHTYGGWGSVPYWNAYVANTQMYGQGTFVDPRLDDAKKYPVAQRTRFFDKRDQKDLISGKLEALHFYQMAIPPPKPPKGFFDEAAAKRGRAIFNGKAQCASCHVPPLFTEPGWPMHKGEDIGIEDFQASRSPDGMYRTTPLRGLFVRMKGGFYHDGRFPDLNAVVDHYDKHLKLGLTEREQSDLIEYLKSL